MNNARSKIGYKCYVIAASVIPIFVGRLLIAANEKRVKRNKEKRKEELD